MARTASMSSAQRGLVIMALVANAAIAALFAIAASPAWLIVLVPLGALPLLVLAARRDSGLARAVASVIGVLFLLVAGALLFFGGAILAVPGLVLVAAAIAPSDRESRPALTRYVLAMPAALVLLLVLALIWAWLP